METSGQVATIEEVGEQKKYFRVLLVDDVPENLILLEEVLAKENRIFSKAFSGVEALKMAMVEDVGLVMLDVQMPQMDGYEVARLLHSNPKTRNIPVVFVTANHTQRKDVLEGFSAGAVDFLIKPLDVTITRAKVDVFERLYFQTLELRETIKERDIVNEQLKKVHKNNCS